MTTALPQIGAGAAGAGTATGAGGGLAGLGKALTSATGVASRASPWSLLFVTSGLNEGEEAELERMREEQRVRDRSRAAGGLPPHNDLWNDPALILPVIQNLATQTYLDKEKNRRDDQDCRLRPYSEGCSDGLTPHHVVPDRAWREPGEKGRYYFPDDATAKKTPQGGTKSMTHGKGLCICVTGAGRVLQHGAAHKLYDPVENIVGQHNTPPYTAPLLELEIMGAAAVSLVTGCDFKDMRKQLRDYHDKHGFGPMEQVRADPYGKSGLTKEKWQEATGRVKAGTGK